MNNEFIRLVLTNTMPLKPSCCVDGTSTTPTGIALPLFQHQLGADFQQSLAL
jgi:hypothetical protein